MQRSVVDERSSAEVDENARVERVQRRMTIPVLVAALVAVPAVFLTMIDGVAAQAGMVLNWTSLAVLTAESVVLFWLTRDRRQWLITHKWKVLLVLLSIPAVLWLVGGVQILRLIQFIGAIRIVRVGRFLRAGRIVQERLQLKSWWRRAVLAGFTLLAAVFVALLLVDPTSPTRGLVDDATNRWGIGAVILAGLLLGGATFIVLRYGRRGGDKEAE